MGVLKFAVEMEDRVSRSAKAAAASLGGLSNATGKVGSAGAKIGDSFKAVFAGILAGGLVTSAVSLAKSGAKYALDAASFHDNMVKSLALIEGSSEKAESTYARVMKLAEKTPFSPSVVGV